MIGLKNDRFTLIGAFQRYKRAYLELIKEYELEAFNAAATATTISWKVADKAQLFADLESIAADTEQIHIGTVNNRYIASAVLHKPLEAKIQIIKILERRPQSTDPLGLDSVDFLVKDLEKTYTTLRQAGLRVVKENNPVHEWLSLRFGANDEFEAKFTDHLVLEVARKELKMSELQLLKRLDK